MLARVQKSEVRGQTASEIVTEFGKCPYFESSCGFIGLSVHYLSPEFKKSWDLCTCQQEEIA